MRIFYSHWSRKGGALLASAARAGFTLIELLVVLSIVMVVTVLVLVNDNQFNSAILLRSLAYEVGLSLREAQLYGVSVRETSAGSSNFNSAYGVDFVAATVAKPNASYPLFADLNDNGYFDDGAAAVVENFSLQNGFVISTVCAAFGASLTCSAACPTPLPAGYTACTPSTLQELTVSFKRPNPNAIFMTVPTGGPYSSALLVVSAPSGATHTISISSTGLIAIQ